MQIAEHPLELQLVAISAGDLQAFDSFHADTASLVFAQVFVILRDRALAQEVCQDIYLEIWRKAANFDPARGAAISWLLRLSRARAIDCVRHEDSTRRRDGGYYTFSFAREHDPVPDEALRWEDRDTAVVALQFLTPPQLEAISMAFYEGLSYPEITCARQPDHLDVATQHGGRAPIGFHELGVRSPSRQRLQPQRAGSGVEVEHPGPVKIPTCL